MGRIRSIKPEFPHSQSIGNLSRDARLLFILLWTLADDSGVLRGSSRMLASLLFPYDDDAPGLIDGWLVELDREGCIRRYAVEGTNYLWLCNWLKHQKIDHASASKAPPFREDLRTPREDSRTLAPDQGSRIKEGIKESAARARVASPKAKVAVDPYEAFPDAPRSLVDEFMGVRKGKRAGLLTQTAVDGIRRESAKAGLDMMRTIKMCVEKNWTSFDSTWDYPGKVRAGHPSKQSARDIAAATMIGDG